MRSSITRSVVTLAIVSLSLSDLPAAEVITIAGNGENKFIGDGGLAAKAGVGGPFGVVIGPDKALYVCETTTHVVRRVDLKTNKISTVAGIGEKGYSGDGGLATKAKLNEPYEVRFDAKGNMFFVEMKNHIVRRVDAKTGMISTVAGTGEQGFSGDGAVGIAATFSRPHSIVLGDSPFLYICDIGNHRIRRLNLEDNIVTTIGGTGRKGKFPNGSKLPDIPLSGPRALDYDGKNSLYLALREGNAVYRIHIPSGRLHHLAGTGKKGYRGDGGFAKDADLSGPKGIALAPNGDVYLADTESHTIRVIRRKTGFIETVVGDGKQGDGPDGDPLQCRLNRPHGVFVDKEYNVYIGDSNNHKVRVLKP